MRHAFGVIDGKKSWVATLVELKIRVGPGAFLAEEERVVSRQPPRPQVPFVVDRVLFVMECSFCLQKETNVQIRIHVIRSN